MPGTTRSTAPQQVTAAGLLDIEDAADVLGVSVRYMRRLVAERRIRHVKLGHYLRFTPADLDAFAAAGIREAVPPR